MLGHPASWQTVFRPSLLTREWSSVYSGPILALILIHGGFFSMGVSLLRASTRSSLRPSGAMVNVNPFPSVSRGGEDLAPCASSVPGGTARDVVSHPPTVTPESTPAPSVLLSPSARRTSAKCRARTGRTSARVTSRASALVREVTPASEIPLGMILSNHDKSLLQFRASPC